MKLKNVLIVVNDIERSRKYYHDLFGLEMVGQYLYLLFSIEELQEGWAFAFMYLREVTLGGL